MATWTGLTNQANQLNQQTFQAYYNIATGQPGDVMDYAAYMNAVLAGGAAILPEQRAEAELRATGLLRAYCTPEQRATMDAARYIMVEKARYRYRICTATATMWILPRARSQNFYQLCVHCEPTYFRRSYMPIADQVLTKKLWVETMEDAFLATAVYMTAIPVNHPSYAHYFPPELIKEKTPP